MTPMESILQHFYEWYFPINIIISFVFNIYLIYLINTTKSALLKNMQLYLLNTTVFELLVSISAFFAQCRIVPNQNTLAVFCYGSCKHFGPYACYLTFAIVQGAVVAATFSILLAFYYRYRLLVVEIYKRINHFRNLTIFSILPIAMIIFQLTTDSDFDKVVAETRQLHPNYDFENNSVFGYSNMKGIGSIIAQSMISVGVYIAPLVALYFRYQINKMLGISTKHRAPIQYCKQLVTGLMIQALIPFFLYVPAYSYFLYSRVTGFESLYWEYITNILGTLTAIINPILTIIYVLPYRRAFVRMILRHNMVWSVEETTHTETHNQRHNFHLQHQRF